MVMRKKFYSIRTTVEAYMPQGYVLPTHFSYALNFHELEWQPYNDRTMKYNNQLR